MVGKLRLAVFDDHPLFRNGVVQLLQGTEGFDVVAEGCSAQEAIQAAGAARPDIMLLDIDMPGGGVVAATAISKIDPTIKILMLTVSENERDVFASLDAGVCGYILKGIGSLELIETLSSVHRGEISITPTLAARLLMQGRQKRSGLSTSQPLAALTSREIEILEHVARGLTNKEVARTLQLSDKTVKHYMTNIMQKLNVRNRVEAVLLSQLIVRAVESSESHPKKPDVIAGASGGSV